MREPMCTIAVGREQELYGGRVLDMVGSSAQNAVAPRPGGGGRGADLDSVFIMTTTGNTDMTTFSIPNTENYNGCGKVASLVVSFSPETLQK